MTKRAFVAFALSYALLGACDDEKPASRDASVLLDGNSTDVLVKRDTMMDVAADAPSNGDTGTIPDASTVAALCTSTGGTVQNTLCCNGTAAFPNSCNVGACGCGPDASRDVATCACPSQKCFDPSRGCVARSL